MKYKLFAGLILIEVVLLAFLLVTASLTSRKMRSGQMFNKQLVKTLMLTDLALWTEARYTRHPSQADFFSPFQDFPSSIEHFPAGSIVALPPNFGFSPHDIQEGES